MNGSNAGEHAALVRAEIPAFAGMTRWLLRELRWSGPDGFLVVKAFAFRSRGYKPGRLLGRRQVVRHRFLVPAFAGSNPAAPAKPLWHWAIRLNRPMLYKPLLPHCLLRKAGTHL